MSRKIDLLLEDYGESHQNTVNKTIHWICVPIIFFSIVGLIRSIPAFTAMENIPYLNWANILLVPVLLYYLVLSFPLFIGFIFFGGMVSFINDWIATQNGTVYLAIFSFIIFILAWIGQFIGHAIEGKKPSFLKDLQFLLVGPAWLMHFIFKKSGIKY
jgi:uncharacterized membrane protein YGL010W